MSSAVLSTSGLFPCVWLQINCRCYIRVESPSCYCKLSCTTLLRIRYHGDAIEIIIYLFSLHTFAIVLFIVYLFIFFNKFFALFILI